MNSEKSFYDLDYIIDLSEKRVEQYTSAYQLVIGRMTNIILVYSALRIYCIPIIQDFVKISSVYFKVGTGLFLLALAVSLFYTIKLLIPVDIAYLQISSFYYQDRRIEYEAKLLRPEMTEEQRTKAIAYINKYIKATYIDELIRAQSNNRSILRRKGSFYYRALIWGLLAIIPYILCVGYHITKKDGDVQKIEVINLKKRNLQE